MTKKSPDAKLEFTYKQFCAVLEAWNNYVSVELQKMSTGFYSITHELAMSQPTEWDTEVTTSDKLSDLSELLWKSLEAGASEVDRIHDETFVEDQIKFFNDLYNSPEDLLIERGIWEATTVRVDAPHPSETFLRLGKPAQMIIVRDGHLLKAVGNYQKAESLVYDKRQARIEAEEKDRKRRQKEREKQRADPNFIEAINTHTRKLVRERDKQCVFCGDKKDFAKGQSRYIRLTPKGYKADEVAVSCKACETKLEGRTPQAAEMSPAFGRFSKKKQDE